MAFAALMLLDPAVPLPARSAVAACVSACAGWASWRLLTGIGEGREYPLARFDPSDLEPAMAEDALILDDVLDAVGPDSRVVRLFDASAMPSPAELKARVDRYLGQDAAWARSPDASQALVDALTELRRSLR